MRIEPQPGRPAASQQRTSSRVPGSLEELRAAVAAMLDEPADAVALDDDLVLDWGLDSIRVMDLVERLRAAGVEVTILELAERPTIRAWDALLTARASAAPPP